MGVTLYKGVSIGVLVILFLGISVTIINTEIRQDTSILSFVSNRKLREPSFADEFPIRTVASDLAKLSNGIYEIEVGMSIEDAIPNEFDVHHYITTIMPDTEAMIVTSNNRSPGDNFIVIVFQGRDSMEDWKQNLNILLRRPQFDGTPDNVRLHKGFQKSVFENDLAYILDGYVEELMNDTTLGLSNVVHLTGHSQGGACAQIMGAFLATKYKDDQDRKFKVITYGSPSVGNDGFKDWLVEDLKDNLSVWQLSYRADGVTRQLAAGFGYVHAGHLLQIYRWSSRAYYHHSGMSANWRFATSYNNHKMKNYVRFFKKKAGQQKHWPSKFENVNCPVWNPFC